MAKPTLRVQLFGDFLLARGGTPVTSVNSPRLQSLLAYLVLHCAAPHARNYLAFAFYPDTLEANARNNLRQLLFELRRALPNADQFLITDAVTVQWRTESRCVCDVTEFENALNDARRAADANDRAQQRAALTRAVELYRGDLFPQCYDDWIVPERERLRQALIDALENLLDLLEAQGENRAALACAQKLLQHNPLHESAYRRVMQLYAASGDRASALSTFHACATTLQRELAVEPSVETLAEYERLLKRETHPNSPPTTIAGISPLVGRARELAQLQAVWRAASIGQPQMIVLQGDAGIGKTRLAEELIAWTHRQALAQARANCYAAENAPPFAPIVAWLRALPLPQLDPIWLAELARLLPELARAHPEWHVAPLTEEWQRQRLFEAIARALLAAAQPLLLLLDDLQWCDRDSLACLRFLLRFDPHARVLIVGTVRADEMDAEHPATSLLRVLVQSDQLITLELGTLDERETLALIANVVGRGVEPDFATQIYRETEGNPLFVIEVARAWSSGSRALPTKVQAVIEARLAQLTVPARELAYLAAIIGRDFTFDVLAHASDADEDTLVRGLDELWRRRIVRERGALTYDFTHAQLRAVIVASLSAARTRVLHRRVAQALEALHARELDAISARLAAHYECAGRVEQAIVYYERAAQVARRVFANQDALEHYQRALALCNTVTPRNHVAALRENLGDLWHWIAQYEHARAAHQNALASVDDAIASARLHRKIGNTWREQYHYPEALQAYAQANRALDQNPNDALPAWWFEWIQSRLEIGLVYYWTGQLDSDEQLRQEMESAIQTHATPTQRAFFFQHRGRVELKRNGTVATPEMIGWARASLAAHQESNDATYIPAAQFSLGFYLLLSGDPLGARAPMETALAAAEQRGDTSLQARCLNYLTIACRKCNLVAETREYAARSLQAAMTAQMPEYIGAAQANQSWVAYRTREFTHARDLGRAALAAWDQLPPEHASLPFKWLALFPLIAVALDTRQFEDAVNYARSLIAPKQQRLPDEMTARVNQLIRDWDTGNLESAHAGLYQSIVLAQELNYL